MEFIQALMEDVDHWILVGVFVPTALLPLSSSLP
jgi:hypothetical protein